MTSPPRSYFFLSYFFLWNPRSGATSGTSADNSGARARQSCETLGSGHWLEQWPDAQPRRRRVHRRGSRLREWYDLADTHRPYGGKGADCHLRLCRRATEHAQWADRRGLGGQSRRGDLRYGPGEHAQPWVLRLADGPSFTFTSISSTEVLSSLAQGTPNGALPPFALLDSVSATQTSPGAFDLGDDGPRVRLGMRVYGRTDGSLSQSLERGATEY